jgi:phage terminase large subunit
LLFQTSPLYEQIIDFFEDDNYDVLVLQGGTSSGKTYSAIQALNTAACENNDAFVTVAGQDMPNLKVGAIRDMETITESSKLLQSRIVSHNKSSHTYDYDTGSKLEFKSYSSAQDAKSGKRQFLFVNEANGIPYTYYTELSMRTIDKGNVKSKIILDYNPNAEFWVHKELINHPRVKLIISDHRHNPFLSESTHKKIEALKDKDIDLWKVYARGRTGKIEGLVFRNFKVVPAIPAEAKFIGYGMDFGFTNDPTTLVEIYLHNGELWLNELIYETGMTNQDIDLRMKFLGISKSREIIADSAEPKSIEELSRLGWNIRGAVKGKDSVKATIDILKRYVINITVRSVNAKKEFGAYRWKTNKQTGLLENEPVDFQNHIIDPTRYVAGLKLNSQGQGKYKIR